MVLDHLILHVNDAQESIRFYAEILGWVNEQYRDPFTVLRVSPEFTIQLAPWGTKGGEHLAFALPRPEFDAVFQKIRDAGIEFGPTFQSVGTMEGPGEEVGSQGLGASLYFFDPNKHLFEIRHYDLP